MPVNSVESLKRDLLWQEHVARKTTNPVQRERCQKAAERLRAQIAEKEKQ